MQKDNHSDLLTKLFGAFIAFFIVSIGVVVLKITWPVLKFVAIFVFKKIVQIFKKQPKQSKQKTFESEIKTPEIFAGEKNLALAKELNLKELHS